MDIQEYFLQYFNGADWIIKNPGWSDFGSAIYAYERDIECGNVVRLVYRPQPTFILASPESGFVTPFPATISEFDHTTEGQKCRKVGKMYVCRWKPRIVSVPEIVEAK